MHRMFSILKINVIKGTNLVLPGVHATLIRQPKVPVIFEKTYLLLASIDVLNRHFQFCH